MTVEIRTKRIASLYVFLFTFHLLLRSSRPEHGRGRLMNPSPSKLVRSTCCSFLLPFSSTIAQRQFSCRDLLNWMQASPPLRQNDGRNQDQKNCKSVRILVHF